jgi:FAD-linked oxidoreductase
MSSWHNWAGNQVMEPTQVLHPAGTEEIVQALKGTTRRVKAIGSGHSFTAIGLTDGTLVQLDQHDQPVSLDTTSGLVTVQAGMPVHRLNALLTERGLGLTNMGDIDAQTVSGAISTGTHGTGRASASIAAQVAGLELVLADGSVVQCSRAERPELFEHARLGLGALGILSTVTFQTEPLFRLHADERPMLLEEVLEGYKELVAGNDHFEFFWFPHTGLALTKSNNRTEAPPEPLSRTKAWVDDELLSNTLFGALCAVGATAPRLIPSINRVSARALSARTYTDVAPKVFISRRRVRFHEMEYAIPRAELPAVFRALMEITDSLGERISFPVEVRNAPADDLPLSTAFGRDTAYVAVHQYRRTPYARYFTAVEKLMNEVGGRPHWGKLHQLGAAELRAVYPRFDDFLAVRRTCDPDGRLSNAYLDRVLGPVG